VIASARALGAPVETAFARNTPAVLQSLSSIDADRRLLTVDLELAIRHGKTPTLDWLLRLDLASSPIQHEQWHGQTQCVGGQLSVEVRPTLWPKTQERWFLRLWLRDPVGTADCDLVVTRPLP
jgi:hypothetical protein